ncbi:TolB family protein [Psychroserpens sp. XS_ASV72]|uniref:TolB family protein n=1 Tax=Psychroserpens sp. XS_ASV72 TaxID=3241293 RepID=UPI00351771D8
MKKTIILIPLLLFLLGCTSDDSNPNTSDVTISIEASGLNDDKLALNNSATFTAIISDFDGDASSLSYRWTLTNENGELSDGVNPLPNPTASGSSINCVGQTVGEEEIMLELLDASNTILASASYNFTIVDSANQTSFGCFDQPKLIYRKGTFNFVLNFDGTNEESLGIGGGSGVAISPDGEWIAQARDTQFGWQMNLFRCDGSTGLIPIPLTFEHLDNSPVFSLDSKILYFTRAVPWQNDYLEEIFSYDIETGALNQITSLAQQNETVQGGFTISPVSGDIAFQRYVISTEETKLAFLQPESGLITDFYTFPDGVGTTSLDWSPDGGDIIFSANYPTAIGIYRINVTSGSQPLLVFEDPSPNTVQPLGPTYYNGGNRIAWAGSENGQSGSSLWSIDANGNDMQLLLDANSSLLVLYGVLR